MATYDDEFRAHGVAVNVLSVEEALAMPGGLDVLFRDRRIVAAYQGRLSADKESLVRAFAAIGRFLAAHQVLPWVRAPLYDKPLPPIAMEGSALLEVLRESDEFTGLGLAAGIAVGWELSDLPVFRQSYRLSELPMPVAFKKVFTDWTEGRVNVTEILDE